MEICFNKSILILRIIKHNLIPEADLTSKYIYYSFCNIVKVKWKLILELELTKGKEFNNSLELLIIISLNSKEHLMILKAS